MALQSFQFSNDQAWQALPYPRFNESLADSLREYFAAHRPYFNDIVKLDEPAPAGAMTLSQWRKPDAFASLMTTWVNYVYRNQPQQPREAKPLKSLWAQWYIGLLVPPLMLALLTRRKALSVSPELIQIAFHETGRAATFWIDVEEDTTASRLPLCLRLEKLIVEGLMPVVEALEASGEINAKLIWNNTGYLMNWFFGEMKAFLDEATLTALRHACFFEKQLPNGQDNPLYRSLIPREGLLVRRTCCQRYKLPDVKCCGDCTIK